MATTSEGYGIDQISVAVVLNRAQLTKSLGPNPAAGAIDTALKDIEQLAGSAAGLNEARGDRIKVTAVDFLPGDQQLAPAAETGLVERLSHSLGSLINAGALIIVTLLAMLLGLRPALKTIVALAAPANAGAAVGALPGVASGFPAMPTLSNGAGGEIGGFGMPKITAFETDPQFDALAREISNSPRERLAKIVELDPGRAALVLKQWLETSEQTTA